MSAPSSNDELLIEKLLAHLKAEGYSLRIQQWYPARVRQLLEYCTGNALEIEAVLLEHPAVAEVAVTGEADATWGERVTAWIVARGTPPGTPLTLADLQTFARERLAPYKLPRALELVAELPRNAMGKVQKQRLRAR